MYFNNHIAITPFWPPQQNCAFFCFVYSSFKEEKKKNNKMKKGCSIGYRLQA